MASRKRKKNESSNIQHMSEKFQHMNANLQINCNIYKCTYALGPIYSNIRMYGYTNVWLVEAHWIVLSYSLHDVMLNMHEYPDISVFKLTYSLYLNWLGHKSNFNWLHLHANLSTMHSYYLPCGITSGFYIFIFILNGFENKNWAKSHWL